MLPHQRRLPEQLEQEKVTKMMNKRLIATLLALPLAVSTAYAQDSTGFPAVKVSGFGTGAIT